MRTLTACEFISLDGVVEEPQTWHFPFMDAEMGAAVGAQIAGSAGSLMGRRTYDSFAASWGFRTGEMAEAINAAPRWVYSNRMLGADWPGTTLLKGDLAEQIGALKEGGDGTLMIPGSITLVRSLIAAGLLDRLELMIHPIILGTGQRLFDETLGEHALRLVDRAGFPGGVQHLTYELA